MPGWIGFPVGKCQGEARRPALTVLPPSGSEVQQRAARQRLARWRRDGLQAALGNGLGGPAAGLAGMLPSDGAGLGHGALGSDLLGESRKGVGGDHTGHHPS